MAWKGSSSHYVTTVKRNVVSLMVSEHGLSQGRACRLAGLNLSTWQYQSLRQPVAGPCERIIELAQERRRFGYRRLHILLRREGMSVNHKAVHRIYCEEGLQVRKRKRKRIGQSERQPIILPERINERCSAQCAMPRTFLQQLGSMIAISSARTPPTGGQRQSSLRRKLALPCR